MIKKLFCSFTLAFLVTGVLYNQSPIKLHASEYIPGGTSSLVDSSGERIYKDGGLYLGEDLSASSTTIRYWDNDYAYTNMFYILEYYNRELFALISTTHTSASIGSTCVTSGIMGVLKGIEVYKNYENSAYPLYGDQIGRYISGNNNFQIYWPSTSNITLSGSFYEGDSRYPLAVLSDNNSKISHVYNESMAVAYYVDKYGASYDNIATSISKYLENTKTSDNYRYRLVNEDDCYYEVSDMGYSESYKLIRQAILDGYPVLIGDNDFLWADNPNQTGTPGGHVMVAVAAGLAQVYDTTNREWITVEEIIYDQGAGKYVAMPIDDVYDFFILDIRLQQKEKYGLFNLFTRWVDI